MTALALAGFAACGAGDGRAFGSNAAGAPPTVAVALSDLVESTVALGVVRPRVGAEVEVGSRLSGVVARLEVAVGDRVEEGELLATLRDAEWRARVDQLAAELAVTEAELVFAQGELDRNLQLAELVSALTVDALRRNVAVRAASVERARAALASARIDLEATRIAAPIAGTVASVSTSVGETMAASFAAPTFVTLIDLGALEIQAFVDETEIGRVSIGQPVVVRVDAFPGRELPGRVRAIEPKAVLQGNVVTYLVLIDLDAPAAAPELRPEMTVHVELVLARREQVVVVPRGALSVERGRTFVVVADGERFEERAVELGLTTTAEAEVVSGLEPGTRIVIDREAWRKWKQEGR